MGYVLDEKCYDIKINYDLMQECLFAVRHLL